MAIFLKTIETFLFLISYFLFTMGSCDSTEKIQIAINEAYEIMSIFLKTIEIVKPVRLASSGRAEIKLL